MIMANQSQDNRAFKPEFYIILEKERRKEREYQERHKIISQIQQEFLDKVDGIEPEIKEEKEKKVMTKKKVKVIETQEIKKVEAQGTLAEIGPTTSLPGQRTKDGWWNVKSRDDQFCTKCAKPIIKGSQYYGKNGKRVHPECK